MNTLFPPYSATPAGRRRRQHIRAQVRHARTRRRSNIEQSSRWRARAQDDDEQGDGELRGDDAKGGVTPPSRFLLSLSKHLIHCHLQTEKNRSYN